MSLSSIQRRAFLVALLTMFGAGVIVLFYWQAVSRGVLPSPVQPLNRHAQNKTALPVTMVAREADRGISSSSPPVSRAQPAAPAATAPEKESAPGAKELKVARTDRAVAPPREATPPNSEVRLQSTLTNSISSPSLANSTSVPPEALAQLPPPQRASEDAALARHWLQTTNERPVVRAQYDIAEVLRLVDLGRGVIVASSRNEDHGRELYLRSRPTAAPLFVPYTQAIADRYASYRLLLDAATGLGSFTAALAAYFPNSAYELAFVPDQALATEIFAQVARASRWVTLKPKPAAAQIIYEGQLTLHETQPSFTVLDVISGTNRLDLPRLGGDMN